MDVSADRISKQLARRSGSAAGVDRYDPDTASRWFAKTQTKRSITTFASPGTQLKGLRYKLLAHKEATNLER
jgi:hypothetical protein